MYALLWTSLSSPDRFRLWLAREGLGRTGKVAVCGSVWRDVGRGPSMFGAATACGVASPSACRAPARSPDRRAPPALWEHG